jgi:hypothetical protein
MSNEIEAAGGAITAGAAAGAIDGVEARRVGDGTACANCGTVITGKYCVECGQPTHVHRSLFHFVEDAAHSIFHFDTRAWRTLPMAAFRPGTLTRNYVMGKRARYISPVALFLFTVFLMFFVFALVGERSLSVTGAAPQTVTQLRQEVAEAQSDVRAAAAELAREQAELTRMESTPDSLQPGELGGQRGTVAGAEGALMGAKAALQSAEAALKRREDKLQRLKKARAQLDVNEQVANQAKDEEALESIVAARAILDRALNDPAASVDGVEATISADGDVEVNFDAANGGGMQAVFREIKAAKESGQLTVNTGNKKWDEKIKQKLDNPELAWYKIQNTAYKFSFLLIPISLPFVWLMFFWKRGVTLFDHAVFVLYSLSFMSVLFIALSLMGMLPEAIGARVVPLIGPVLTAAIPVHMFFQLKGAYQLKWFSALWRTIVLLIFAFASLSAFIWAIFLLGFLG